MATIQSGFGRLPALMASGYLIADAFDATAGDQFASRHLSELLRRLAAAECLQWRLRRKPLGTEDWRRIAGEDTGSMFEICAVLGGRSQRLRRYGHLVGVVYHGCDDVADQRGAKGLGGGGDEDIRDGIRFLRGHSLARGMTVGIRAGDFAASVRRPGGLIAAPLDPLLASLCLRTGFDRRPRDTALATTTQKS